MRLKRKRSRDSVAGGNQALDMSYNDLAGALKTVPIMGALTPLGDAATARNADRGSIILFFNPGVTPVYVAFGDASTVPAPVAGAGSPVPAGGMVAYPLIGTWFKSSALCYAYILQDDSWLSESDI